MKRFLTVLLVIAVMFTFSFGSAFALPNDANNEAYASVADAQKDALKAIEAYAKLSDYTAEGQSVLLVAKEEAKAAVKAATTLGAVKAAVEAYEDVVDGLTAMLRANVTLEDAADKAMDMAEDYRLGTGSLYDILLGEGGSVYEDKDATGYNTAVAKLQTAYAEFEVVVNAAKYEHVGTVEGVEAAFDKLVAVANEVGKAYFAEGADAALQDAIDAVVEAIEAEHDAYIVDTTDYSAKVFADYEAALKAGVKAAKAAKTWDALVDVYETYIGGTTVGAYEAGVDYEVVIVRDHGKSVFEKLHGKTKEMEADMAAAEKVLKELGAYDYHVVLLGGWAAYEAELDAMEDLADGDVVEGTIAADLAAAVSAGMKAKLVNEAVDAAVEAFEAMQTVEAAKVVGEALVDELANYFLANNYEQTNGAKEIENLAKLAKTELKAAAGLEEMIEIGLEYYVLMDAIPTVEEIEAEKAQAELEKAIDKALEEAIKAAEKAAKENEEVFALTADQQLFVDKFVAYAKENMTAEEFKAEIADVLANSAYKNGKAYGVLFAPEFKEGYSAKDQHYVDIIEIDYDAAVAEAKSWTSFFKAVDAAKKALSAYKLAVEVAFEEAVADAKEAVEELPVVKTEEDLKAYDEAFEDAKDAAKALIAATQAAYGWADVEDLVEEYVNDAVKYGMMAYNKVFEAEYVRYLAELEEAGESVSDSAEDFYAIAADMTGLMGNYAAAEQKEISTIITTTYKALRATKVVAEMDKIAEKAIADLEAVKEKAVANDEYAETLAFAKEEAAKYFEKYYGVKFTSDAETQLQLAYDIMDAQNDLATVEAQIEAVEGLKITAGSTAKKGSITVKWTVKGDASKIDGYQVWKSTKKNSGFKKITAKTTKTQITNTKGLKAGTRYYYKVRAFQVIEGKTYYSDWSNKAYRKAK